MSEDSLSSHEGESAVSPSAHRDETNRLLGRLVESQEDMKERMKQTKDAVDDLRFQIRHLEENKSDVRAVDRLESRVSELETFRTRSIAVSSVVTAAILAIVYEGASWIKALKNIWS